MLEFIRYHVVKVAGDDEAEDESPLASSSRPLLSSDAQPASSEIPAASDSFFSSFRKHYQIAPPSLYIYGAPGTGKSQLLREMIDVHLPNLVAPHPFKTVYLNCMGLLSHNTLFANIYELLADKELRGGFTGSDEAYAALMSYLAPAHNKKRRTHNGSVTEDGSEKHALQFTFLILDEIDALSKSPAEKKILYQLFEISKTCPGTVVICASNLLDLTSKFTRLDSEAYRPVYLQFPPYTKSDLIDIIRERNERAARSSKNPLTIDPKALDMLAARVSNESGDVRKLLDICNQAAAAIPSGSATITLALALKVWAAAHKCNSSATVRTIADSPLHTQLALCAVLSYQDEVNNTPSNSRTKKAGTTRLMTASYVETRYKSLCKQVRMAPSRFQDLLDHLLSIELLSTQKKTINKIPAIIITPNVQWVDLRSALTIIPNPTLQDFIPEDPSYQR